MSYLNELAPDPAADEFNCRHPVYSLPLTTERKWVLMEKADFRKTHNLSLKFSTILLCEKCSLLSIYASERCVPLKYRRHKMDQITNKQYPNDWQTVSGWLKKKKTVHPSTTNSTMMTNKQCTHHWHLCQTIPNAVKQYTVGQITFQPYQY